MLVDTCRDPQGAGNWDQPPIPSAPQRGRTRETLRMTAWADPETAWKCTYKREPQSGRGAEDGLVAHHHSSSAPASLSSDPPSSGTAGEKTLPAE